MQGAEWNIPGRKVLRPGTSALFIYTVGGDISGTEMWKLKCENLCLLWFPDANIVLNWAFVSIVNKV